MSTPSTNAPSYKLEIVAVIVHTAHTSHTTHAARHPGRWRRLLRLLRDRSFSGKHQPRSAARILERRAHDFGWIDHAGLDQILIDLGRGIETKIAFAFEHRVQNNFRLMSRVARDLFERFRHRSRDHVRAGLLVLIESH